MGRTAILKESRIEAKLVRLVRQHGGLCYKFVSPQNPGVPDRIIITPRGRIIFVELKTEVGSLQKIQEWQIGQMRRCGADVRVLHGLGEVQTFVEEVLEP